MAKRLNAGGIDRMTATAVPTPPERPAQPATQHAATEQPPAPLGQGSPAPAASTAVEQVANQHAAAPAPAPAEQAAPAPSPFAGAHATVGAEADVYYPGGQHSLVRDAYHAQVDHDPEAAARFNRFNAQLRVAGERAGQFAPALTTGFPEVIPPGYRGDLMVDAIDKGRPFVSRLGSIPLSDATPFRIPVEGDFTGVGQHVEGTAHVAAGTLTMDEVTVVPQTMSGAFEISRELVDASNPALDSIALRAMLRDYRNVTEAYAATNAAAGLTPVVGIDTGAELEQQLIEFLDAREAEPAFIASGLGFYTDIATEQAGDGRARYPYLNPTNASGSSQAGFWGINVQGVPLVRTWSVNTDQALLVDPEDVLWAESPVRTFRFEEVQGPGVIKLALFAYAACRRLRDSGVRVVSRLAA